MLRYSQQSISPEDEQAVLEVLRSPWLTSGPVVERFEAALAEYVGARHAVAVNSGTAALHLAYLAARRRRLMTSPLSFVATANAALLAGMDVTFWDVDPVTGNAALPGFVDCLSVPVHFAGRSATIPATGTVVEDACHALGAMDYDGCSRVGSCAHSMATVFSFHPVKPITTGEGGAITTNDDGLAQELRMLRSHGRDAFGLMRSLGFNYRMPEMAAALGLSQLKRCDEMREKRKALARYYVSALIMDSGLFTKPYTLPRSNFWSDTEEETGAWHLYPVRIHHGRRDEVKAKMQAAGIGVQTHYSPVIPAQPYYRDRFGYVDGTFPEAEAWAAEELSLPLHAGMTEADVQRVVDTLREALI